MKYSSYMIHVKSIEIHDAHASEHAAVLRRHCTVDVINFARSVLGVPEHIAHSNKHNVKPGYYTDCRGCIVTRVLAQTYNFFALRSPTVVDVSEHMFI